MKKPERNKPCPCGSGFKFKKCCGSPGRHPSNTSLPKPPRVDHRLRPGQVKAIPPGLYFEDVETDRLTDTRENIFRVFGSPRVVEVLNWGPDRLQLLRERVDSFCSQRVRPFQMHIQNIGPAEIERTPLELFASIYWNEIDQCVFYYRNETVHVLSDRVERFFALFDDHLTCASLARHVLETTISIIANQYVLATCFNSLNRDKQRLTGMNISHLSWASLEQFARALCSWQTRHLGQLETLSGLVDVPVVGDDYIEAEYQPTMSRQLAIAAFVAKQWDSDDRVSADDLHATVDTLKECYRYLCLFVHPNPQQLRVPHGVSFLDEHVRLSVHTCGLKALEGCLHLLDSVVLIPALMTMRFQDLIEDVVYMRSGGGVVNYKDHDGFVENILHGYKDIALETTEGRVEIHTVNPLSRDAERIGRQFDKLTSDNKTAATEFLGSLAMAQRE